MSLPALGLLLSRLLALFLSATHPRFSSPETGLGLIHADPLPRHQDHMDNNARDTRERRRGERAVEIDAHVVLVRQARQEVDCCVGNTAAKAVSLHHLRQCASPMRTLTDEAGKYFHVTTTGRK
ncbi:hypothetical protein B0J12DRAFT_263918 [Macrophomina phaseolina]|uniref:Secreted protein n=1 Tax=Macrophomina phaseolina TaxID=35725 RepID=A0ABQ8FZ96_9PEZI|nr:hypothetical protein B0J12DRAFT_263918 [Macrophomina phaseolina]